MLYRLAEFLAAILGILWPLWQSLPATWQTAILSMLIVSYAYKRGHNSAVWSDYHAGVERLRQTRNARLK